MPEIAASDRPTFAQAFASEGSATDSQAVTPSADTTPAVSASADAIVPPADPSVSEITPASGPIPFDRHKSILDGAYKERDALKTQLDTLSWATQVDRTAVQEAARIGQLYQQDRAGYIRQVLAEAITDPTLAPLVRSEAARALASGRQIASGPPPIPDVQILGDDGKPIGMLRDLVEQYAESKLGPIKQDYESRQAQAKDAADKQRDTDYVQDIYSEALDVLPGFKEHQVEIAKVFEAMPGHDHARNLRAAWKQVVGSTLGQVNQVKAQTLDELKTKAAASHGSMNPGSAVVAATHRPTSFHDKSLKW